MNVLHARLVDRPAGPLGPERLVLPPEKLTRRQFMDQYRLLLVKTALLGWLRGAYEFAGNKR